MWKKIVHIIESELDSAKYGIERLAGLQKPLQIKSYLSYGNNTTLRVRGRVLVRKDIPEIGASDSSWRNFLNMMRHWFTDEVPGAKLTAAFRGREYQVTADEEGHFSLDIPFESTVPVAPAEVEVLLRLDEPIGEEAVETTAISLVPGLGSEYGIISDVDDTVIHTGATDLLEMVRNTLLGNAHTRVVFNGVSALYGAFSRGVDGRGRNPFFYVTSSPWNLYDLITEVFELQSIPRGPLFMDDWGIEEEKFIRGSHGDHKKSSIRKILQFYPDLKFILTGDSGQEDPEIYSDILDEFPDRILAVYIRDVTDSARDEVVRELMTRSRKHGIDLVLSDQSSVIAEHAVEKGLIRGYELPAIQGREKADLIQEKLAVG